MRWLDVYWYGHTAVLVGDVFRTVCVVSASVLVGYSAARISGRNRNTPQRRVWLTNLLFITVAALVGLQEAEQWGRPVLVWRLPLCLTVCVVAWLLVLGVSDREERRWWEREQRPLG